MRINSQIRTSLQCPTQNIAKDSLHRTITCYAMNSAIRIIIKPLSLNSLIGRIIAYYMAKCRTYHTSIILYNEGVAFGNIVLDEFSARVIATPLTIITIRRHKLACVGKDSQH